MKFKCRHLRDYLYFEEITVKDFAKIVGCSPQTLVNYMQGKCPISMRLARSIFMETGDKLPLAVILKNNPDSRLKKGKQVPSKQEETTGIPLERALVEWKELPHNAVS